MKLSQLSEADQLARDVRRYRAMELDASGYPRKTGYLDLGDRNLELPHATVNLILADEWARIEAMAAALGIEVDE